LMGCAFELNELKKESPINPAKTLILICQKHLEHYTHFTHIQKECHQCPYKILHANIVLHTASLSTVALHTTWKDHFIKSQFGGQVAVYCPLWLRSSVAHNYPDMPHNCRKTFQMGPNHTVQY
jgi:hypothetical protein